MQISEVLLHSNRAEARGEGLRGDGLGGGRREGERGELYLLRSSSVTLSVHLFFLKQHNLWP